MSDETMNSAESAPPDSHPADSPPSPAPGGIRFSWPPPGLEAVQGVFWQASAYLGLGSMILVVPLLLAVARAQPFYSMGPFGNAWWILACSSLFGLLILLTALGHLFQFFRFGWKAGRHGIPLSTLLKVAADRGRDMGFLLQGARVYQGLSEEAIRRVAGTRVTAALLFLAAALWPAPGFFAGVFLGGRGILQPFGLTFLTLGPTGVLLIGGLFARALEGTELRTVFRGRSRDPWKVDEVQASAREWAASALGGEETGAPPSRLVLGGVVVILLAVLLALPAFTLTLTNSVGPILAMVATPKFGATQDRAAKMEVYRAYRLPRDSSITPIAAGEALQSLLSIGRQREDEILLPPVRAYENLTGVIDLEEVLGLKAHEWPAQLFGKVGEGLTPEMVEGLATIAAHPALGEFEILARAPAADFLQARYRIPFPEGTTPASIPIPRFGEARQAGYAMVARAALELSRSEEAAAETTLREIISSGYLLGEEGVSLIDNLIGFVLVRNGGDALESFYRATGRTEDANALARASATTERAVDMAGSIRGREGIEAALANMPEIVRSPDAIRGLRWEFFLVLNGITPCLNAYKVVFGPDQDFQDFQAEAREALVRYPSEGAYFDLLQGGWFGYVPEDAPGQLIGKLVAVTLGGTHTQGSCTKLLASVRW